MVKKFVPRQRKHKVLARQNKKALQDEVPVDSNAAEILPEVKMELEVRKQQLRKELSGEGVTVSGQKAKRLEKYIESKLKKDENRKLLAQLANNKIDTSLFSSTSNLGQVKETKRQAVQKALKEHEAGVRDKLYEDSDSGSELESESFSPHGNGTNKVKPASPENDTINHEHGKSTGKSNTNIAQPTQPVVGAGLKRPLALDYDGRPVIQKRQKRGGVKSKLNAAPRFVQEPEAAREDAGDDEDDGWNGFSSENDSAEKDGSESESDEEAEDDETSEDDSDVELDGDKQDTKERSSAFKAWAHQQRNDALGYQPVQSGPAILDIPKIKDFKPRPVEQEPLPLELQPTNNTKREVFSVTVERKPEIQEARLKLPVVAEEQKIMEAIHNNNIVVICGATGSGKTTQVPQFLFEAGYGTSNSPTPGLIGVTQPRKVAAVSMSKRVGQELGDHSHQVAYQIRFEQTTDENTSIKFMTDGVLLREVSNDVALRRYSAIIIDEAHERSVNTDVLIGMLSRSVRLRQEMADEDSTVKPLKLIIMSATLRIDDLTKNPTLFSTPPLVLNVEGRQFPVTVHFARQTRHDYVEEVFKKISRGHKKLPPGGFLVFLTSYDDISRLSKKLKLSSGGLTSAANPKARISANDAPLEVEDIEFGQTNDVTQDDYDEINVVDEDAEEEGEDDAEFDISEEVGTGPLKMHVLPLYSLLPTKEQMRVFDDPPEGSRQIILATNIAETSLTIPGIRYVFDCGRAKERRFDKQTGVQSYEIGWISKASANQRSGRAGRTGPGHCYRMYSSAVYERDFAEFTDPELLRMPIEGVVLQLKAMRIQHVINFPFPTPPDRQSIAQSEKLLMYLSAINSSGAASEVGRTMARFPLPPRFARILLIGHLHGCIHYTIALVAALSVAEIFIPQSQAVPILSESESAFRTNDDVMAENRQTQVRQKYGRVHKNLSSLDEGSDAMKLLRVVAAFAHEPTEQWCEENFVRFKALQEAQKLRRQLTNLLQKDIPIHKNLIFEDKLPRPDDKQIAALKQMVVAGFIDQVAIRGDLAPVAPEMHRKPRRAIDVPFIPLHSINDPSGHHDVIDTAVYIHPSSSLASFSPQELPQYIVYSHLQRAAASFDGVKQPKTRMLALTDVTGAQLASLAKGTALISYGKPIKEVQTNDPSVRECWVVPSLRAERTGGQGWPLPVSKVKQKRVPGKGWVVIE